MFDARAATTQQKVVFFSSKEKDYADLSLKLVGKGML